MENQDLLEALDFIDPGSLTYEEWTMVGMGLKQAGFPVTSWEQWSARDGGRYHRGECTRKWGSFHGNANPVTENSIFKLARDHGWAGPAGYALDWNDVIDAPAGRSDGVVVDPHWLDVQELAISLGVRYGTGKEWQSDAVLTDGKHTLQVRIYNTYGDVSPWSSCEINVQNQPGAALAVYAEERWGEVLLCWGADNGYILRDGKLITKAEGGTYTDRTSAAAHQYIVRVFDAEGYYTDSAPVLAAPSVPYAAIGLRDGTDWLAMKYATSYQNYSKAVSLGGSYQQYWGKERPVWHDAGNRVVTHTISHACKREEELLVLRSLAGQEVIYKDRDGHLAIGVFKDLQESREHGCTALSFSITETQQEAVKYDPV